MIPQLPSSGTGTIRRGLAVASEAEALESLVGKLQGRKAELALLDDEQNPGLGAIACLQRFVAPCGFVVDVEDAAAAAEALAERALWALGSRLWALVSGVFV